LHPDVFCLFHLAGLRQLDMPLAGAMAGLAIDAQALVFRHILFCRRIIRGLDLTAMAFLAIVQAGFGAENAMALLLRSVIDNC
jgi:hypothetical protein